MPTPTTASKTIAMIGHTQSCFFSSRPVREIERPTDVPPNVIWAWPVGPPREDRTHWRSQLSIEKSETHPSGDKPIVIGQSSTGYLLEPVASAFLAGFGEIAPCWATRSPSES